MNRTHINRSRPIFSALTFALLLATSAALVQQPAWADGKHDSHAGHKAEAASVDLTDGEVRKVDVDAAKVTLKHADIKSLDMPAMTMVFAVKDKAMLTGLKVGDKVKFKVASDAGKYTITEMQVMP